MAVWLTPLSVKPAAWLTAGDIEREISQVGANRTVGEIFDTPAWTVMVDRIAQGRPDWLRLAPRLLPGVDADSAEELRDHLGLALPRNAAVVLAVADPANGSVTGVDSVCSFAFGNNQEGPLPRDFVPRSIRGVEAVRDKRLQAPRNRCLAVLHRGVCPVCGGRSPAAASPEASPGVHQKPA